MFCVIVQDPSSLLRNTCSTEENVMIEILMTVTLSNDVGQISSSKISYQTAIKPLWQVGWTYTLTAHLLSSFKHLCWRHLFQR